MQKQIGESRHPVTDHLLVASLLLIQRLIHGQVSADISNYNERPRQLVVRVFFQPDGARSPGRFHIVEENSMMDVPSKFHQLMCVFDQRLASSANKPATSEQSENHSSQ